MEQTFAKISILRSKMLKHENVFVQLRIEPGDIIDELFGEPVRGNGTQCVVDLMRAYKGCPIYMHVVKVALFAKQIYKCKIFCAKLVFQKTNNCRQSTTTVMCIIQLWITHTPSACVVHSWWLCAIAECANCWPVASQARLRQRVVNHQYFE